MLYAAIKIIPTVIIFINITLKETNMVLFEVNCIFIKSNNFLQVFELNYCLTLFVVVSVLIVVVMGGLCVVFIHITNAKVHFCINILLLQTQVILY
jgi:hypothetical protein